jgi:hypothetical protein
MAVNVHHLAVRLFWITWSCSIWRLKVRFKFDIFERLRDGTPLWIAAVEGLEEARNQMKLLAVVGPGDYLIYSEERCLVVERMTS